MDMTMIPPWMSNLDDEDMTFIKRFLLASGSMKEVAAQYIALIKRLAVDDKLDFDTAKILISEYRKQLKQGE